MLVYMVLMVCLAGIVEVAFPDTQLQMKQFVALVSGGVPAVLKPVSVCRDDGRRPNVECTKTRTKTYKF